MRICSIGDVIGRPGRRVLRECLPQLRQDHKPDLIIANGENVAGGAGITPKTYHELTEVLGCDIITSGNHWLDQKDILPFLPQASRLLLPANMNNVEKPQSGLLLHSLANGKEVAVMNLLGTLFMGDKASCPFQAADNLLSQIPSHITIRLLDFHAETTSEKQAMAHYLAEKVSLIWGTHTHVPTADERIINNHTAYISDVGMSGGYDSVIGMEPQAIIQRFLTNEKTRKKPSSSSLYLYALITDIEPASGKATAIKRVRYHP